MIAVRPRPARLWTQLALAAVTALGATAAPVLGAAAASPGSGALATLPRDVLSGLGNATDHGAAPSATTLHITVQLDNPRNAALRQLAQDVYDPHSPQYHHFLTAEQIDAEFGMPASAMHNLQSWLHSGGATVSYASPSNDFVQAVATVGQLQQLFHTALHAYAYNGQTFIANVAAPKVPQDLGIANVVGLNTWQHFSLPKLQYSKTQPRSSGCLLGVPTPCEAGYDPQDMWSLYNQPAGNLGQGQTMAVFGEGQTDPVIADLRRFEIRNNLPRVPVQVKHVGAGPWTDNGGQGEWDLDTQSSTGMSPLVDRLDLYFTASLTDADVQTEFTAWKDDPSGPKQANASFGECESDPLNPVVGNPAANPALPAAQGLGDNLEPAVETSLMPAIVAEGRTLFNSTGDTGSSCPAVIADGIGAGNGVINQGVPLASYPAVSNFVLAVGGTLLYSDGGTPAQRTTTGPAEVASPYTGGGQSVFNQIPKFQQNTSAVNRPCAPVDYNGTPYPPGQLCRGIPDVAALFGDVIGLGYNIVLDGGVITTGGTSLSSPLWMGMWTRAQAAAKDQVNGLGFAAPLLYDIGNGPNYSNDFFDIQEGSNGLYQAAPGWDYVSGWGSPNLTNLIQDLDGGTKPVVAAVAHPQVQAPLPGFNPCGPVFTSPAQNAVDYNLYNTPFAEQDQLDIVRGDLGLSTDGKSLVTTITVSNLSATLPPDAVPVPNPLLDGADWVYLFNVGDLTYYVDTHLDGAGAITYTDGNIDPKTGFKTPNANGHPQGSFNPGTNGTIVVAVPLADIGNPKLGTRIGYPMAYTDINAVLPFLNFPDAGGAQYDYALGATCPLSNSGGSNPTQTTTATTTSSGSGAPLPNTSAVSGAAGPAGVAVALLAAAGVTRQRRRRRRS